MKKLQTRINIYMVRAAIIYYVCLEIDNKRHSILYKQYDYIKTLLNTKYTYDELDISLLILEGLLSSYDFMDCFKKLDIEKHSYLFKELDIIRKMEVRL
jgi:hypothetical protein